MRPGKDLIGKPIYSLKDGRLLGSVKDLFVDLELNVVSGVFLGSEGLFSRKILAIMRENIAVFGIDSVLVTGSDVVTDSTDNKSLETWLRREEVQGRSVDTPGGTKVGNIGDVLLDENAKVVGYWLSKVRVAGPIAEHRQVMNDAIIDTGNKDGTMTIDLGKAEHPSLSPLNISKDLDDAEEEEDSQEPNDEALEGNGADDRASEDAS
jgi:uncharacterized protein YrrD